MRQTSQKVRYFPYYLATLPKIIKLADLPCWIDHGPKTQQQPHVSTSMPAEAVAPISSAVSAEPGAPAQPVASSTNLDSHQNLGIEASFADASLADRS